jgi:hypothetical protein
MNIKIDESNRQIAEFMAEPISEYKDESDNIWIQALRGSDSAIEAAKYHTSWDWLMPVVEKIEKETPFTFNISRSQVWLADENYRMTAIGERIAVEADSKIEAVYLAVVQFIKWYNKNKKP